MATKATLEALLRDRKLDRTLTTTPEGEAQARAPLDIGAVDARLLGGIPRGRLSEVVGPASSGRTSLAWAWLGAATRRGEWAALIDTFDRFDPASAADCGLRLDRLLWVRGQAISKTAGAIDPGWRPGMRTASGPGTLVERALDRALKALNLVVQSGVCTAVVLDLADAPAAGLARIPASTWLRLQRVIDGTETTCLLIGPGPIARSAGGVTLTLTRDATLTARWAGTHDRARRLAGLSVHAEVVSPRRAMSGEAVAEMALNPAI
ncbi:MAG: hypothetical protein AB7O67_02315 [Vicinamibacterales bacterium]